MTTAVQSVILTYHSYLCIDFSVYLNMHVRSILSFPTAPLIQPLDTDDVVFVNDDPTRGVVGVIVPPVSDQQGDIR